jgi:hypothetical protein
VDIETYAKIADKFCVIDNHQRELEDEIDFIQREKTETFLSYTLSLEIITLLSKIPKKKGHM